MRYLIALAASLFSLCLHAGPVDEEQAAQLLQGQPATLLIDVRTAEEFAAGALPGAQRIGHEEIAARIAEVAPDRETPIVVYCRSGRRSSIAQDSLQALGYRNVVNGGGYEALDARLLQP